MPILKIGDKQWAFNASEFSNRDAMDVEKFTGMDYFDWQRAPLTHHLANTALVWIVRRRHGEADLQFADVEYAVDDFEVLLDPETIAMLEEQARLIAEQAEAETNPTRPAPRAGRSSAAPRKRPQKKPAGRTASPKPSSATGQPSSASTTRSRTTTTG